MSRHSVDDTTLPSMASLYRKALFKRASNISSPMLTDTVLHYRMRPYSKKLTAYHSLVGWEGSSIHPCWLQVRALPLHMMMLTAKDFPFATMGLVHTHNRIRHHRLVLENEPLVMSVSIGALAEHRLGWQFDLRTSALCGSQMVWDATATMVARTTSLSSSNKRRSVAAKTMPETGELWSMDANLGRRYAAVSGDWNPIHLTPWLSRLFGFKRPIAHGMLTDAKALSALNDKKALGTSFTASVHFKKPVSLPSQALFEHQADCSNPAIGRYYLYEPASGKTYLKGQWSALDH